MVLPKKAKSGQAFRRDTLSAQGYDGWCGEHGRGGASAGSVLLFVEEDCDGYVQVHVAGEEGEDG